MRVRLQNGTVLSYPTATFASRREQYTDLYTKKDGGWIAQVPNTAIIEPSSTPCAVESLAEQLVRELETSEGRGRRSSWALANLKRQLAAFDARSRCWQETT